MTKRIAISCCRDEAHEAHNKSTRVSMGELKSGFAAILKDGHAD